MITSLMLSKGLLRAASFSTDIKAAHGLLRGAATAFHHGK
jgi:hypothetical protein